MRPPNIQWFFMCVRVCAVSRSNGDHKCSYMNKSDGELVHCIAMSCTCCITIEDDCVACCDVTNSMFGLSILANLRKLDELNERSDENGGRQAVITTGQADSVSIHAQLRFQL